MSPDEPTQFATRLIITKRTEAAKTIAAILSGGRATERMSHGVPFYAWRDEVALHLVVGVQGFLFRPAFADGVADWRTVDSCELIDARVAREPVRKNVHELLRDEAKHADSVVIATDFDDEGELVGLHGLEVILECNSKLAEDAGVSAAELKSGRPSRLLDAPNIKRARYSALTEKEIRKAFQPSEQSSPSEHLARRADTRREIDLIWDSTLTRFVSRATGQHGPERLGIGYAGLPALAIVVERELERRAHVPKPYWAVFAAFEHPEGEFTAGHSVGQFWDEQQAHAAVANTRAPGIVKAVERRRFERRPPAPFNTTALASSAAAIGIPPPRAMELAEDLYVQSFISYPGTLTSHYKPWVPARELLVSIARLEGFTEAAPLAAKGDLNPTSGFKMDSVHPPIHPTKVVDPSVLPEDGHREIYELIVRRFLATFAESAVWEHTRTEIEAGSETYYARSNVLVEPGFLAVYPYGRVNEEKMPALEAGQELLLAGVPWLEADETKPPSRIGQGKLVELMEEWFLGEFHSPAAPDVIQKLYDHGYIQGNPIEPSEAAVALVNPLIRSGTNLVTSGSVVECERLIGAHTWAEDDGVDASRKLLHEACDLLVQEPRESAGISRQGAQDDRVPERSRGTQMRAEPRATDRDNGDAFVTTFERAVAEAQAWFRTAFAHAPAEVLKPLLKQSTRQRAKAVDDCVQRFSRAELEGRALGRYGPIRLFPALGDHQAKRLRNASMDQRERVRDAIAFGVAMGYTFMAATQESDKPDPNHSGEEIWNIWIPNLNSGLIQRTGLPVDILNEVHQSGATAFQKRALDLGLGGFGKKARLRHIGAYYAQAGALLHAIQIHAGRLEPDPVNLWSYDDNPA